MPGAYHQLTATKLSFLRPEGAGPFSEADLHLMRALMPHLRTAVAVHRRLHRLGELSGSALGALELLACGLIFVSRAGRLVHWNGAAQEISRRTRCLVLGAHGELQACTHDLSLRLADAIRRACDPAGAGTSNPGALLRLPAPHGEVQVFVAPGGSAPSSPFPTHAAALFVTDMARPMALAEQLRTVYGASPAEAALGEALANGKSLKEFATERDVSLNTVKSQLKALSMKVGAKRQVDVVRAILAGPAMFRRRA